MATRATTNIKRRLYQIAIRAANTFAVPADAAPSTDVDASPDLAQADTVGADQSVSDVQGSGSPDLSGLRFVGGGGCSALEPGASGGGAPLFLLLLAFVGWGWRRRRSEGSA